MLGSPWARLERAPLPHALQGQGGGEGKEAAAVGSGVGKESLGLERWPPWSFSLARGWLTSLPLNLLSWGSQASVPGNPPAQQLFCYPLCLPAKGQACPWDCQEAGVPGKGFPQRSS